MLCPNDQTMQSSNPCLLDLLSLPEEEYEGHIITSLTHSSLVSIFKLYDAECTDEFKA